MLGSPFFVRNCDLRSKSTNCEDGFCFHEKSVKIGRFYYVTILLNLSISFLKEHGNLYKKIIPVLTSPTKILE